MRFRGTTKDEAEALLEFSPPDSSHQDVRTLFPAITSNVTGDDFPVPLLPTQQQVNFGGFDGSREAGSYLRRCLVRRAWTFG
jgi:hypothetical protein